ncbi:MAG: hypothetical protein AAGJ32_08390 [Pseudomonadota bacterium]
MPLLQRPSSRGLLLAVSALALVGCETLEEGDPRLPEGEVKNAIGEVAGVIPDPVEEAVTYTTEVERIPQLDGSVIVVTTTRGSDGSVFIDEERTAPTGGTPGTTRGVTMPGGLRNAVEEAERRRAQEEAERLARAQAEEEEARRRAERAAAADDEFVFADRDLAELGVDETIAGAPAIIEARCDPDALMFDFTWPPPEPSARIEIPRSLVLGGIDENDRSVSRIQSRVESALETAGYVDQSFYTIGCDGFAIITRMEQIDRTGEPLEDGLRFNAPGEDETWSLTGYLTRLFYAPPGFYRQIILAGTDEIYDEDNLQAAPDEDQLDALFTAGSSQALDIDAAEMWGTGHKLHALIYEFETQGTRNVKQRRPSPIPAERHVETSGIYGDLD